MRLIWHGSVLLTCLTLAPLAVAAQTTETDSPSGRSQAEIRQERVETTTKRLIWWNNDTKVETLSLSEAQRTAMDDELLAFLRARSDNAAAQREAYEAFGVALAAGDETAAREAANQVVELTSAPVRLQSEMMIKVIGLLSAQQRQSMVEEWPRLMSTPWVRQNFTRGGMNGGVPPRRATN